MIEIISDLQSLRGLKSDWNRLAAEHDSPLLQFDWFYHCAETLCDESGLRVYVYRNDTATRAIAPLVLKRRQPVPWLEILGAAELHEPTGLLYDDAASLTPLLRAITASSFPINLQRLPATSPVFHVAKATCRSRALLLTRPSAPSCFIAITGDWETFHGSMSSSRRADFRRTEIRAKGAGELSLTVSCPTGVELDETLALCFRIEGASWKGRNGTALRDNPALRRFFEHYAATAARKGILRLFIYSVGKQPVAMQIAVEFRRRLWGLKIGYDAAWSHIAPGLRLANDSIRYAFEHELNGFEFLGSEETWQHTWPVSTHDYRSLLIYPASWQGLLGLCGTSATFLHNRLRALHRKAGL